MVPVFQIIGERLPQTLTVVGTAYFVGVLIALPIGIYSAYRLYSWFDQAGTFFAMAGFSVPNFFTGNVLILVFSVRLGWFPTIYDTTLNVTDWDSFVKQLRQMAMPVMVLGLANAAAISRYMRSSMLDNMAQDYVRTARAKGMNEKVVVLKHVLRNSLNPVVTVIALGIPSIFGGAIITENLFGVNGIGSALPDFEDAAVRPFIRRRWTQLGEPLGQIAGRDRAVVHDCLPWKDVTTRSGCSGHPTGARPVRQWSVRCVHSARTSASGSRAVRIAARLRNAFAGSSRDSAHTAIARTSGEASPRRASACAARPASPLLPMAISTLRTKRSRPSRLTAEPENSARKARSSSPASSASSGAASAARGRSAASRAARANLFHGQTLQEALKQVSPADVISIADELSARHERLFLNLKVDSVSWTSSFADIAGAVTHTRANARTITNYFAQDDYKIMADLLYGESPTPVRVAKFVEKVNALDTRLALELSSGLLHNTSPNEYWLWTRWLWDPTTGTGILPLLAGSTHNLLAENLADGYSRVGLVIAMSMKFGEGTGLWTDELMAGA